MWALLTILEACCTVECAPVSNYLIHIGAVLQIIMNIRVNININFEYNDSVLGKKKSKVFHGYIPV